MISFRSCMLAGPTIVYCSRRIPTKALDDINYNLRYNKSRVT